MIHKLSNGNTFEMRDNGDGTHSNYLNGKWVGWGTNSTPEEEEVMETLEAKYILGIDPLK